MADGQYNLLHSGAEIDAAIDQTEDNTIRLQGLAQSLSTKLGKTDQAADSAKLGGQPPAYYATADALNKVKTLAEIMLAIYPVGAVYISTVSTSPATLFGGTWEQIQNVFLLAAGSEYEAGSTGGAAKHTLTAEEMPNHYHSGLYWAAPGGKAITLNINGTESHCVEPTWNGGTSGSPIYTGAAGGGQAHNNMPPYESVYMWKRTA